jgi:hypothetical protein
MRGAMHVVSKAVDDLSRKQQVTNIVDVGLALGMQIPWTYELSKKHDATLYSVDINLKSFFKKSIHKYLPGKNKGWDSFSKGSDRFDFGFDPIVSDPLAWSDLQLVSEDPPTYRYGEQSHYLVHSHSTKFLESFDGDLDVVLIDGDHRYVTVWNDLEIFHAKNGKLAFFDDIDTIFAKTEASMDDYLKNPGIEISYEGSSWHVKGPGGTYFSEIMDGAGEKASQIGIEDFITTKSIGEKRGVLTAVEDFINKHPEYRFSIEQTGAGGKSTLTDDFKQCGVLRRG